MSLYVTNDISKSTCQLEIIRNMSDQSNLGEFRLSVSSSSFVSIAACKLIVSRGVSSNLNRKRDEPIQVGNHEQLFVLLRRLD